MLFYDAYSDFNKIVVNNFQQPSVIAAVTKNTITLHFRAGMFPFLHFKMDFTSASSVVALHIPDSASAVRDTESAPPCPLTPCGTSSLNANGGRSLRYH